MIKFSEWKARRLGRLQPGEREVSQDIWLSEGKMKTVCRHQEMVEDLGWLVSEAGGQRVRELQLQARWGRQSE